VANQQKGIATQIVAAEEFLLQEFVLLCREWAWKSLREARKVLAADQMGEFSRSFPYERTDGDKRDPFLLAILSRIVRGGFCG
jgi:hypothetical protein